MDSIMEILAKVLPQSQQTDALETNVSSVDLTSSTASDVSLNLERSDVVSMDRIGNDLTLELDNGDVARIKGFFEENQDGKKNRLFFSEDNSIAFVDLAGIEGAGVVSPASVEAAPTLIFGSNSAAVGGLSSGAVAGIVSGIFAGVIAASDGDSGNDTNIVLPAPIITTANGTEVTGTAEPGSTVTITVGNGPEQTVIADPVTGEFTITPIAPDTFDVAEGVSATATDAAGNESDPGTGTIVDETPPAPIISGVSVATDDVVNAAEAGSTMVPISGNVSDAQAGDVVTITVNGNDFTGTVDANGDFTINVDGSDLENDPDTTIDISAEATDAAGNSTTVTSTQSYTIAPPAPIITGANEDEVTGTAEPGSTVTITIGDGPEQTVIADPVTGEFTFTPVAPDTYEDGEPVSATATDAAGNESGPGTGTVVGTPAEITGIAIGGDSDPMGLMDADANIFNEGETITVTVTYDQAVDVTGTPFVLLDVGGEDIAVAFASGSGTNTLVFEYVVHTLDSDTDGVTVDVGSLDLNGGSIVNSDAVTVNADLNHGAASDQRQVDTTIQTSSAISAPAGDDDTLVGASLVGAGDINGDGIEDFISVHQIMILTMAVADQAKLTLFLVVRTCRPFRCRILRTAQAMDSLLMAPRPEMTLAIIFPLSAISMATA